MSKAASPPNKDDLHVFVTPADQPVAMLVFLHGGGWVAGSPQQFDAIANTLATQRIASLSIEYRIRQRHQSNVYDSLADTLAAIPTLKTLSHGLPLCIAGGSAGGLLAVHLARALSPAAAGLILLNPMLDLSAAGTSTAASPAGGDLAISPLHIDISTLPPTLILHGDADQVVPLDTSRKFTTKLNASGQTARIGVVPGAGHGFFNAAKYRDAVAHHIADFVLEMTQGAVASRAA